MPKKPEEGRITWSNVYDAPPLTEAPKIKFDDTARGPLLIMTNSTTTIPTSSSTTTTTTTKTTKTLECHSNKNDNNHDSMGDHIVTMNDNEQDLVENAESGVESWKAFEAAMTESARCGDTSNDDNDDHRSPSLVVVAVAAATTLGDTRGDSDEFDHVKDDVEDIDVDESL